jgi:hypothetical protein
MAAKKTGERMNAMPRRFTDVDACADYIVERVGKRIVLGIPLGIGKPNPLVNALYRRVKADPSVHLEIITALSLNPPTGKSELEERFLAPIRARVWGDYPRLDYLDDRLAGRLPPCCETFRLSQMWEERG